MITSNGKLVISKYIGGQLGRIADSIVVGAGSAAATVNDVRLQYEVSRLPVSSINVDLSSSRLVFKGSLQPGLVNTVYEIGLYSSGLLDNGTLYAPLLNSTSATWTNGTLTSSNARANPMALKIDFSASGTTNAELSGFLIDASRFIDLDYIVVGFFATSNLSSAKVRLGTDASNYYEVPINGPVAGYNVYRVARSTAVKTGAPDWSALSYAAVRPTGTSGGSGSLYFDGLRFEANSLSTDNMLVARSVLVTPQVVDANVATDIEYSLGINIT